VGSLSNTAAIVRRIASRAYDRVCVATGGFYENASLEDMVFGGDLVNGLGCNSHELDDDARLMRFAAEALPNPDARLESFHTNWIGRALDQFGMADDVDAIVVGRNLPCDVYSAMANITPEVVNVLGEPVIMKGPLTLSTPYVARFAACANKEAIGDCTHEQ
jgi:hypothetical protein